MALEAVKGVSSVLHGRFFVNLPVPKPASELSQQTMIVTGSNTGLGLESTRHLSRLGVGKIIMAVRSESRGLNAKKDILADTKRSDKSIEVWTLDMDSYESIKAFAERASSLPRLDAVLANAGLATSNFALSEGIEKTLNVNVVSTFLLYLLLTPKMRESAKQTGVVARYVIPNSALHYLAPLAELKSREKGLMERLSDPEKSDMANRYPFSKLLVLYAVREFAERGKARGGQPVIINTPNPSWCVSGLAHETADAPGFKTMERVLARSTEEGSRTLVHGVLSGIESNGEYLSNCKVENVSCNVSGKWGQETQKFFFDELLEKLEKIQPGISLNI